MKVVQYITPSQIGGAELHVADLTARLRKRGHEVVVVCPKGRPFAEELAYRNLPTRTPATTGKLDPLMLARLMWWLRRDRVDIIHTHLSTASLLGSLAARLAGIPAVATVHGLNDKTCFARATGVIAVSHAVKRHLVAQGIPPERVTVIHNGVDLPSSQQYEESAVRKQWDLPAGAPVLVTTGRLAPSKGHEDLLQALRLLLQDPRWQALRLLIVGTGALLPDLQAKAAHAGLAERVIFTGFQRDVSPFLRAADVFVLPSTEEGLSLSSLEAMALSRPVVACRVGGVPEVVAEGETGLLVPPHQPAELAAALDYLLRHPEEARRMGEAGAARVRALFDAEQMVSQIEAVYRGLVAGHSP